MKYIPKRIAAAVMSFVLFVTPLATNTVFAEQIAEKLSIESIIAKQSAAITKGEFVMLINSTLGLTSDSTENFADVPAGHPYESDFACAKAIGYLKGSGDNKVYPDSSVSGAEAAVIINSFLGFDMSKVQTDSSLNISEWAKSAGSNLLDLGMSDKESLEKKELTVADAAGFINALSVASLYKGGPYELKQVSEKDDFFAYTNRKYIATQAPLAGTFMTATFTDVEQTVNNQMAAILDEILKSDNQDKNSDEWKIKQIYEMYMDNDTRTKSIEKIKPVLDEIRAVKSISELNKLAAKYDDYYSLQTFYTIGVESDAKADATKWAAVVTPSMLDLGAKEYYEDNENFTLIQTEYKKYVASLLKFIGETENVDARAETLYDIEKDRAKNFPPMQDLRNPEILYTLSDWKELENLMKASESLNSSPEIMSIIKKMNVYCFCTDYIKYIEGLYIEKNLQSLKDFAMLSVVSTVSGFLGEDFFKLSDGLNQAMLGQTERTPMEQRAQNMARNLMNRSFSTLYAQKYSSEKVKSDVTDLIETIRDKYRERIGKLDWMGEETKKAAIEKLDAIKPYVAFSSEALSKFNYDVKAKADGGTLIDTYLSIADASKKRAVDLLSKPYDPLIWDSVPSSMVNAFYDPSVNSIIVPAGILQGVFYDSGRKTEENLSSIGAIIAHEITHAFDNSGAKYDKNGTLKSWWSEADYAKFSEYVTAISSEISQIKFIGEMNVNGELCTGEAIADLGAMSCVMDIASDNPDYDTALMMKKWAEVWAARISPEASVYLLSLDSHLPNKLRSNFILQQLDEFYNVFGITENDGMYMPKERRIAIW